jgi:hypothetical protein
LQSLNKLVTQKLIGVHLQRASDHNGNGEISFGIVDESKFSGSLIALPNIAINGLWQVSVDDAAINGTRLGIKDRTAIIDTGTCKNLFQS